MYCYMNPNFTDCLLNAYYTCIHPKIIAGACDFYGLTELLVFSRCRVGYALFDGPYDQQGIHPDVGPTAHAG